MVLFPAETVRFRVNDGDLTVRLVPIGEGMVLKRRDLSRLEIEFLAFELERSRAAWKWSR
jgi:hypothetical protein